tara:strand:+ start:31241 stop:32194 length:954 start_codon:yes stop_codon:yes gene_type:complete
MKIVVVTGCLGLIGSHITRLLLSSGYMVLGIDKITYAANEELIHEFSKNKNFTFLKKDICDLDKLPDCDYIINTAAETHVGNSIIDDEVFIKSNILGVQNILKLIKRKPANVCEKPIFLHFSTDEVYGDIATGSFSENSLLNPSNPYSATKASADLLIKSWHRTFGIEYVIMRPTNNYGTHQDPEKLIPLSVKLLKRGRKINLHDGGEPIRNWLHAEDTARAVLLVIESGKKNEVFNISGGFEQKNIETVKKIINCYYQGQPQDYEQFFNLEFNREGQDIRYNVDDFKLRSLGWKPLKNFDKEIKKIVEFYKNNFKW